METAKKQEDAAKMEEAEILWEDWAYCLSACFDWIYLHSVGRHRGYMGERCAKTIKDFADKYFENQETLWAEIRDNIHTLKDGDLDNYIYSLLKPFREYANKYNPIEEIGRLRDENRRIKELMKGDFFPLGEHIKKILEGLKEKADNEKDLKTMFGSLCHPVQRTVEEEISYLLDKVYKFALYLDRLLLKKGKNLMWYQEQMGLYILLDHNIEDLDFYFGSRKLAQKYIDEALPKTEPQQAAATPETQQTIVIPEPQQGQTAPEPEQAANPQPQQSAVETATKHGLPSVLDTDKAHEYFAKAIEIGLMDEEYHWLKGKQLLACFCHDMSQALKLGKGERTAWQPFEKVFGIQNTVLRSNYNDIQKTGIEPSDIGLVNSIFK